MSDKNPIEKEVDKLSEQWEEFIDLNQPILRWLIDPDASQIAFAFVKLQEEFGEDTTDFFIPLHSDFHRSESYGQTLAIELNNAVASGLAEIGDEGKSFAWQAPDLSSVRSGYDALIKSSQAVLDGFGKSFENLVLVISPVNIADGREYLTWWSQVCRVHREHNVWPKKLKFLVFDNARSPTMNELADACPDEICSLTPPLDLRSAINKVLAEADDGTPGARFRQHFVDLTYSVQENDLAEIEKSSQAALDIAGRYQWYDMWVSVLMLRASGLLNLGYPERALRDYRQAQRFAEMGTQEKKLGCEKLWLQALISEGSALLSLGEYQKAAEVYRKSAELADHQGDAMMCMDSWRMESFCHEQLKKRDLAWQSATNALRAARKIDPQQVANTTAFYVGEALLRVAPDPHQRQQADDAMKQLLGSGWREMFKQDTGS